MAANSLTELDYYHKDDDCTVVTDNTSNSNDNIEDRAPKVPPITTTRQA